MAEDTLGPVELDLAGEDQHLIVFGDTGAGKTTVLRSLITQLVSTHDDS
ncbi:FtsK/SpoIIIE domain-containing protein [Lapillicoccus jejuensis]|nr:FtsK/SpoIIIE domain-containing protein [Lapillicoccus jejuensis]